MKKLMILSAIVSIAVLGACSSAAEDFSFEHDTNELRDAKARRGNAGVNPGGNDQAGRGIKQD